GTEGNSNTAVGTAAMILNLSGTRNTAVGTNALVNNMIASENNAVGFFALYNNDSSGGGFASANNAFGAFALANNIDGAFNSAFGASAPGGVTTSPKPCPIAKLRNCKRPSRASKSKLTRLLRACRK